MTPPNDLIRQAIRGRGSAPQTATVWKVLDDGSPLWLPEAQWPQDLIEMPMPGAQVKLKLRAMKTLFDRAGQQHLAQRVDTLMKMGGRDAEATIQAVHARLGVRADNTVVLVGLKTDKVALTCPKIAQDTPLKIAVSKFWSRQDPGPLERLSVPAWRREKPGRPVD